MDIKQNEDDILKLIYCVKNFGGSTISITFNTGKQYDLVKKVFRYSNNNYIKPEAVYKLIIKDRNEITIEELLRYLIGLRDYIFRQSKVKTSQELTESYYKNEIKLEKDKIRIARLKNEMKKCRKVKRTIKRGYNGFNEFICDIELYCKNEIKLGSLVKRSPNFLMNVIRDWKSFNKHLNSTKKEHKQLFKKILRENYSDSYIDKLFSEAGED